MERGRSVLDRKVFSKLQLKCRGLSLDASGSARLANNHVKFVWKTATQED